MLSLEELKRIELDILKEVDEFCHEKNIRYSIFAGTLLGAVRHKGFIPWDDDIDVAMPREDYEKFIILFNSRENSDYKVLDYKNVAGYQYLNAKVINTKTKLIENCLEEPLNNGGVYIDIFPIDSVAHNKVKYLHFILNVLHKFKVCSTIKKEELIKSSSKMYWFKKIANKPIFYLKKMDKIISKNSSICGDFSGNFTCGASYYDIMPSDIFKDWDEEIEFEGCKFKCIRKYKEWLQHRYGDYMTLPPIEKRVTNHNFVACWKEDGNEDKNNYK